MTPGRALDPVVELRLGPRHARVPLDDLALRLRLPVAELRGALLALLLATPRSRAGAASPCLGAGLHHHGPAEGEGREGEARRERAGNEDMYMSLGTGTTPTTGTIVARDGVALRLAESLADPGGLATYRRLVERHPAELLGRALAIALRAPRGRVRATRAAYFMGVVAKLAAAPPPHHDRPHPPAA